MIDQNEHLMERFGRGKWPAQKDQSNSNLSLGSTGPPVRLNINIRDYVKTKIEYTSGPPFLEQSEIPTSEEISIVEDDSQQLDVPMNQVVGPWASKHKYLEDHYALLREDGIAPLRNVVSEMKAEPHYVEADSLENSCLYEKVNISGLPWKRSHILS